MNQKEKEAQQAAEQARQHREDMAEERKADEAVERREDLAAERRGFAPSPPAAPQQNDSLTRAAELDRAAQLAGHGPPVEARENPPAQPGVELASPAPVPAAPEVVRVCYFTAGEFEAVDLALRDGAKDRAVHVLNGALRRATDDNALGLNRPLDRPLDRNIAR